MSASSIVRSIVVVAMASLLSMLGTTSAGATPTRSGTGAGPNATTYPTTDWRFDVAPPEAFAPLEEIARADGSVRAMVGLQVRFRPEGTLSDRSRDSQRAAIAAASSALLDSLRGTTYTLVHSYLALPFVSLDLSSDALVALQASGLVPNLKEEAQDQATLATNGPIVEATETAALGFTGSGETIAILDTGVDTSHPFFGARVVGEACFTGAPSDPGYCPNGFGEDGGPGSGVPCTFAPIGCQHGTHVAGIAAGSGPEAGVAFSGVAPGASIVSINVFHKDVNLDCPVATEINACPMSSEADQIAALEFVHETKATFGYAAVNMSLGGGAYISNCDGTEIYRTLAIMTLHADGIATVVSAGNEGKALELSAPACISWAVSVGAADETVTPESVWSKSNSATFLSLLAPGVAIGSSIPGGLFGTMWGTSMAAPFVAGAFAVLRAYVPGADVPTLLAALKATGKPVTDPKNLLSKPRLRLLTALVSLGDTALHSGFDQPIQGGRVVSNGVGVSRKTPGSGSITINGIAGGDVVTNAFLYWMTVGSPDTDTTCVPGSPGCVPGSPVVVFQGADQTGTLVGASRSPCSTAANGGATRVYRADVTGLVSGNGSYTVSDVGSSPGFAEGASLVIVLKRASSTTTFQVAIDDGALTAKQNETMSHDFALHVPVDEIHFGTINVGVGDGQGQTDGPLTFDTIAQSAPNVFKGSDGPRWDDRGFQLKGSFPAAGTIGTTSVAQGGDCLSWAYAALVYPLS